MIGKLASATCVATLALGLACAGNPGQGDLATETSGDDGGVTSGGPGTTSSTGPTSTAAPTSGSGPGSDVTGDPSTSSSEGDETAGGSTTGGCQPPLGDPPARAIGSVSNVVAHDCPDGTPAGATCRQMLVTCPEIPDLGAQVAITEPPGPAMGTVVMLYGGGGTVYFDEGFPAAYLASDLRVVQIVFPSEWEEEPGGSVKAAACRVATLLQWAFDEPHGASRETGFCAHMHSGGSGGLGYALAHYGSEAILDYAQVDAGPVFGRIDHGCDPDATGLGSTMRFVCDALPEGPFVYGGASALIDGWQNTTSCGPPYGDASAADLAQWAADSVVSPGADYDYPQTEVGFWYCANDSNEAAGQGSWFADEVLSSKSINCVTGTCSVEPPWSDPGGFDAMVQAMGEACVPRHCPD